MNPSRRGAVTGALVCLVGGLVLLGSGVGDWVTETVERDLELAVVEEESTIPATTFAPALLPVGLLAVLIAAPLLGLARGRGRPIAASVTAVTGIAGVVVVGLGIARALDAEGTTTAGPWVALLATLGIVGSAVLAQRRAAPASEPALSSRYDIDAGGAGVSDDPEDEWHLASDEAHTDDIDGHVEEDR